MLKIKYTIFSILIGLFCIVFLEVVGAIVLKSNPEMDFDYNAGIESFEPGNFYFKPHHYYALEVNPEFNRIEVNKYGLRGEDFPQEKPPGEYRIACLGGSTTQGMKTESLQKELQEFYTEKKIRVINGGIGTYTSAESLIAYLFKISYLNPDLIVIYHATNDVFPEAYYNDNYPDYRQHRKIWLKNNKKMPKLLYKLMYYSKFLKVIHYKFMQKDFNIWAYSLHNLKLNHEEAKLNIEKKSFGQHFRNNIQRLITVAKTEGRDVLLMTFILSDSAPDSWKLGIKKLNDITRDLAKQNNVYLFDFKKYYDNNPPVHKGNTFTDACHFTFEGDKVAHKCYRRLHHQY